MTNYENSLNEILGFSNIKIKDVEKVNDYLFIILDNDKKILTNGNELYDVSEYGYLSSIFNMGDKLCAVFKESHYLIVVDVKTKEILYEDVKAIDVKKLDEKSLYILKVSGRDNIIYNIETKKYLPVLKKYELEYSLGSNLYVFAEKQNSNKNFTEYKRYVINANGKVLLKDIEGFVFFSNNHLIIVKNNEISIIGINEESTLETKTIKQNEKIISKPIYYDGNVIIIEKETIKKYNPNLQLINEIKIDGLEEIIDCELVDDILKLCLPLTVDKKQVNKHLFVNLKTGKFISHIRIERYPYWEPTTFIGQDSIDKEITNYYFYNAFFEPIVSVSANSYYCLFDKKENIFVIRTTDENGEKIQLLNAENGNTKEIKYNYFKFHSSNPYGYGINSFNETIDFFDENFNVIFSGLNYKKLNLKFREFGFNYFIINNYICIINPFFVWTGDHEETRYRFIIQDKAGNIILNSIEHKCYPMGNLIRIVGPSDIQFLNTITGELGNLFFKVPTDLEGNIDFNRINDINSFLVIDNNNQLQHPHIIEKPMIRTNKKDNFKN